VTGRVDRTRDQIRLQHHAGSAARRRVVHGAVFVGRMIADIDRLKRPQVPGERFPGET